MCHSHILYRQPYGVNKMQVPRLTWWWEKLVERPKQVCRLTHVWQLSKFLCAPVCNSARRREPYQLISIGGDGGGRLGLLDGVKVAWGLGVISPEPRV